MSVTYFHYADINAFKNIVENKEIWATHVRYLNDYQEYNSINQIINEFIEDKQKFENQSPESLHFSELVRELWFNQRTIVPFIASFSKEGDLLSQWRGYADDGKGVSIGFELGDSIKERTIDLEEFFKNVEPGEDSIKGKYRQWIPLKVKYLNEEWDNVLYDYLQKVYVHFKDHVFGERKFRTDYKKNFQIYTNPLWLASIGTKNKGFSEENEVRLIYFSPINIHQEEKFHDNFYENELHYRIGKFGVTPYLRIKFEDHMTLKKVILGPKYYGREWDVQDFLYKNKFDFANKVKVSCSEISYQ